MKLCLKFGLTHNGQVIFPQLFHIGVQHFWNVCATKLAIVALLAYVKFHTLIIYLFKSYGMAKLIIILLGERRACHFIDAIG